MPTLSEIADHFRDEATRCRAMGSDFMGGLLGAASATIERPGALHDLIGNWPGNPRADALAARLASALHAAVLSRRDGELAALYPTPDTASDPARAWAAAERFIARDGDWVRAWLKSPPQTNEVRRTAGLLPGISLL